jgi:hypothetical protein
LIRIKPLLTANNLLPFQDVTRPLDCLLPNLDSKKNQNRFQSEGIDHATTPSGAAFVLACRLQVILSFEGAQLPALKLPSSSIRVTSPEAGIKKIARA